MSDPLHQILLLFGMAMFFGLTGGKIFRYFKIPQVVGYIIIGIILGMSGLGIFDKDTIRELGPFTNFALGLIGFMIGGELKFSTFKKYGKSIITIMLFEGMFAYLLVGAACYIFTRNIALSILLAALSSATAPAATADVIWEYKAKGVLSATVLAIIALDDGLSLMLYGLSKVFAESAITGKSFSILHSLGHPILELGSSLLLGALTGVIINFVIKRIHEVTEKEHLLVTSLGAILITSGVASIFNLDLILCNMALGMTLININPKRSQQLFAMTKQIAAPVYVIFFVLIGARLQVNALAGMGAVGGIYLIFRTLGKVSGSYVGAIVAKADIKVKRYLGTCLFSQAGVAIGLAIAIYQNFSKMGPQGEAIGLSILNIITATTFVVQMIGPSCVKWSIGKAGEIGREVNEEDILNKYKVSEIMAENPTVISEKDDYNAVMKKLKESEFVYFPVVDIKNNFKGIIQLDHIRSILFEEELNPLIKAVDMMVTDASPVLPSDKLLKASQLFDFEEYDYLPVLNKQGKLEGVLPRRSLKKFIKRKLWEAEVG
ncbi:MAG: cation:proton antiporter [Pseudomonadota bacterium]